MSSPTRLPNRKTRREALALPRFGGEAPPPERRAQDALVLVSERDPEGWPVAHYRVTDTITRMVKNGLAEPAWAAAGDRFRRDFVRARMNPLQATDLRRARGAGGREQILDEVEDARQRLYEAMRHLGGMSSPAGSVIWYVVGAEISLQQWALRQVWGSGRPLRHEVATGILIGALAALCSHYEEVRRAARAGRPGG